MPDNAHLYLYLVRRSEATVEKYQCLQKYVKPISERFTIYARVDLRQ